MGAVDAHDKKVVGLKRLTPAQFIWKEWQSRPEVWSWSWSSPGFVDTP